MLKLFPIIPIAFSISPLCAIAQIPATALVKANITVNSPAEKLKQWSYTCPEVEGMRPVGYGTPNNPANKHHHLGKVQAILDRVVDSGKIFTTKDIEAIKKELSMFIMGLKLVYGEAEAPKVHKKITTDLMNLCKAYNKSIKK